MGLVKNVYRMRVVVDAHKGLPPCSGSEVHIRTKRFFRELDRGMKISFMNMIFPSMKKKLLPPKFSGMTFPPQKLAVHSFMHRILLLKKYLGKIVSFPCMKMPMKMPFIFMP